MGQWNNNFLQGNWNVKTISVNVDYQCTLLLSLPVHLDSFQLFPIWVSLETSFSTLNLYLTGTENCCHLFAFFRFPLSPSFWPFSFTWGSWMHVSVFLHFAERILLHAVLIFPQAASQYLSLCALWLYSHVLGLCMICLHTCFYTC